MAGRTVRLDVHVFDRVRPVGERPHHSVGIVGIDILADRDYDLATIGLPVRGALQAPPYFGPWCAIDELDEDDRPEIAQRLVHDYPEDTFEREVVAQMVQEQGLQSHFLDDAGFARGHLANDGDENGRTLVRNGRYLPARASRCR